ncbi:MAG: 23S rRNA (pseudouridine(1915)-N(3))-methyltransferase RlmH [Clostridia bacterium]|nr:23S rRNA (pseudouridine(1915)-N(3))-methyltransferase RlmH [Clostridia bacterium]
MNVTIIHVGDLKEDYYAEAVKEYEKRLCRFCRVKNVEIKEEKLPDKPSDGAIKAALEAEGKKITDAIPDRSYKIALCVEGKQLSSEELAKVISDAEKDITFIIGSSHGLSEQVKSVCDLRLSVSKMTFPHRLMRVILAEQIYRAFSINACSSYHK